MSSTVQNYHPLTLNKSSAHVSSLCIFRHRLLLLVRRKFLLVEQAARHDFLLLDSR